MSAILEQLGLDQTFFVQLGLFAILFLILEQLYFKPFLKLFQVRHKRTILDREAAEKLMSQAQIRLEEYRKKLQDERANARKEYDTILNEAKKEEASIYARVRNDAKKITQEAALSAAQQRDLLRKQLEGDIDSIAKTISETLLLRKV